MSGIVSVYVAFADVDEAERIGRAVVEARLAACINILGSARSIYRWQGAVETAEECVAILKTAADRADTLVASIAELHSYEVPAITVWPAEKAHPAYSAWVIAQTR